jgi:hypothetical protein
LKKLPKKRRDRWRSFKKRKPVHLRCAIPEQEQTIINAILRWGAITVALFVVFLISTDLKASLPLTETINTIAEGEIEVLFREEYLRGDESDFRREEYGLGLGVLPQFSLWYRLQYLHRGVPESREDELGDTFLHIWYYLGDFFNDHLHAGLLAVFRLPTGRNAYEDATWRTVSFGNNELKVGPVFQFDLHKVFIHLNILYVFREGDGEGLYDGISLNPLKKETYTRVFGLNFMAEDSFLEKERLKNDYLIGAVAINTNAVYPLIPYVEFFFADWISQDTQERLPIENGTTYPRLASVGFRYFFSTALYLGIYTGVNLCRENAEFNELYGFDFGFQF